MIKPKIGSKWSALTFASVIVSVIVMIANMFGITSIPEEAITQFITMVIAMFVTGGAVKVVKNRTDTHRDIESYSGDSWYQTNIDKTSYTKGNAIAFGTPYLVIKTDKVRSYFTAILRDSKMNVLNIGQSSAGKPISIALKDKKGKPLKRGNYELQITGDKGTSDSIGTKDKFTII